MSHIGFDFIQLDQDVHAENLLAEVAFVDLPIKSDFDNHIGDKENPHEVSYTQLLDREPQDGEPHARLNNDWQRVVEEANEDGTEYLRIDGGWATPNRVGKKIWLLPIAIPSC